MDLDDIHFFKANKNILTVTITSRFFYIKLSPLGSKDVAPEFGVGEFVLVDLKTSAFSRALFLTSNSILHKGRRYPPRIADLILVVFIICFLLDFVKL